MGYYKLFIISGDYQKTGYRLNDDFHRYRFLL